jgi:HlyD family secretion protein
MKRNHWIAVGTGTLAAVAALAWAFAPRPVEVELAPVTQGRFETTIDEDGRTRLTERYVVSAPLTGRLSRIALREGDRVAADAVVAQLTPVLPALQDERTLRELSARVETAAANVERAGTRIERAKVALQQAQNERRRSEQLAQQGFVAPTKIESDRLAELAAAKEVESASAEQHVATHEVAQARAALGAVRQPTSADRAGAAVSARGLPVRSPIAGQVLRVLQTSEGTVALGTPLLELGDTARMEVVAELLTTDALSARPGSRVVIERWGGSGLLEGMVSRVEPAAFTKVSALGVEEQRVRVLIDIVSPQAHWQALGDGFRVGLRIVTLAQDAAVQVPVSAVFPMPAEATAPADGQPDTAPRHAVFIADGNRARLVPVQLAGRNGNTAWLSRGVAPGASVIVYPPRAVRDGTRVALRKV